eukprot:7915468-Ditylum_brightwellii.AAC.1
MRQNKASYSRSKKEDSCVSLAETSRLPSSDAVQHVQAKSPTKMSRGTQNEVMQKLAPMDESGGPDHQQRAKESAVMIRGTGRWEKV